MLVHYKIITALVGVGIAATIIALTRRDKLRPGYSLWWMFIAFSLAFLGIFPEAFDVVGHWLGISYPPILALILAVCMLLVKIMVMDIERSNQQRIIRTLAQRLAILESEEMSETSKRQ